MFPNLKFLNYNPHDSYYQIISFAKLPLSVCSSTLLELHINVSDPEDCLHLLDGRFNQLRVFNVKIQSALSSISTISEVDFFCNLKMIENDSIFA
ncbi:unnamed protein product [Rotaria sp. Silwood2]|nr:unnamed protein product [Rotaria sp. Silwood2]